MVATAATALSLCNVVTVANDVDGDGAATGLRSGPDGTDPGFVGVDTGAVPGSSPVGSLAATKVHVLEQLIAATHSQINGKVMVVSPG